MQSGIPVSPDLHSAFQSLTSTSTLFALPCTIEAEALIPQAPVPYTSSTTDLATTASHDEARFYSSLSLLAPSITPGEPCYLLVRRYASSAAPFVAVTYIPSNAPVRKKTLFASTRATLVRELGSEKFSGTVFATEIEEVIGESAWRERDEKEGGGGGKSLLGERERELEDVRRAEEEERSHLVTGTAGRDTGIGGAQGKSSSGVMFPVGDGVREALKGLQETEGELVQLAIDLKTESLTLAATAQDVQPSAVESQISSTEPRYTFYHYPSPPTIIFIYTCPTSSKIRERMLYASSRIGVLKFTDSEGIRVDKKIEASAPDEVNDVRLREEVAPKEEGRSDRGFARPKRPGRR